MDPIDQDIVRLLQADATLSVREIGERVGLTGTPCWRRIQNLEAAGVISGRVAIVEPTSVNLRLTAHVFIRTNQHNKDWVQRFVASIAGFDEVVEAYRTSGEFDYMLKVMVPDMAAYDDFYLRLIEDVDLYDVRTMFAMEEMKRTTAVPLHYA